jgi:hypothetical protein
MSLDQDEADTRQPVDEEDEAARLSNASARKPVRMAFRMPDWFLKRVPGSPPTEEERARLKKWFTEQLRDHPLMPADPPPAADSEA